jgi:hypothetical protein
VERDERDLADAIDRYWDALMRGEATTRADIDAELGALVGRLHAAGAGMPPLFPDRLQAWSALRQMPTQTPRARNDGEVESLWSNPNGRNARFVSEPLAVKPRRGLRWAFAQAATAAMLLITLAVGFAAVRQRPRETPEETKWTPALVRAVESGAGDIVDKPLLQTTFPSQQLPGGAKEAIYYQLSIPPGVSLPFLAAPYCGCFSETLTKGVGAEIVRSGAYTLRLDAPVRVQRSGSSQAKEEVPPGKTVTLGPGDAVIYPNYAATGDVRNAGDETTSLIGVAIVGTEGSGTPLPSMPAGARAELLTSTVQSDWSKLPAGPLNVAFHELTLPPGASIGPYPPIGLEALHVESGIVGRNFLPPGKAQPDGQPIPLVAGATTPFLMLRAGTQDFVANTSEKPADLLALLIEPVVSSASNLAP